MPAHRHGTPGVKHKSTRNFDRQQHLITQYQYVTMKARWRELNIHHKKQTEKPFLPVILVNYDKVRQCKITTGSNVFTMSQCVIKVSPAGPDADHRHIKCSYT